jgi:predicted nucleotide-binding protein (sugar kinase/HSP70/actin superfamily)
MVDLMNKECEKDRELLLELSEIDSLEEDFLPSHILECDQCRSFFEGLKKIQKELVNIGNILNETLPKIDITNNIKTEVARIQKGESIVREVVENEHNVPEFAEWHSYIENELNEVARYKCELKLEKSDVLKKEIAQIRSFIKLWIILERHGKT